MSPDKLPGVVEVAVQTGHFEGALRAPFDAVEPIVEALLGA